MQSERDSAYDSQTEEQSSTASSAQPVAKVSYGAASVDDLQQMLEVQERTPEAPQWSPNVMRTVLTPARDGDVLRVTLAARDSKKIIGFVVASVVAETAELESIALLQTFRGQGIGRALLQQVMSAVQSRGAQAMQLEVSALNFAAVSLYTAMGFVTEGTRSNYYSAIRGGVCADALLMGRRL
jgi:ribosomal-protein-alanine N-acetyltransferase